MYQKGDWPFHQNFCFAHYKFDFFLFKNRSRHDNKDECMLLAEMQHSQTHMTLYRDVLFLSWGGKYFARLNHWWWYYCLNPLPLSVQLLMAESPGHYVFLVQKLVIKTSELIVFGVTINGDVNKIIVHLIWHNLSMVFNTVVKVFFEMLVYFCMTTSLRNDLSQSIACSDCLVFWFVSTKPADISLMFYI